MTPVVLSPPAGQPAPEQMTRGLTNAEATRLLSEHGPNILPAERRRGIWNRVAQQLRDPLIIVLLAAAALTLATHDHADAVIIAAVILANTTVGVVQEVRADSAIAALRSMTAAAARVIRDGTARSVSADSVVPGDVLVLGEGDIVAADAQLFEAAALLVDESAMTGESVPAIKDLSEGARELAAGTVVVHGRGLGVVTNTGAASAMGRIATSLASTPSLTPLQRRLARLGRNLAGVAAALCLVVMTIGLIRGEPLELMALTTVSLVVAAVPESLPAVVTLSLALGARRMARRHAIVRRLPAVETLGSVTVLATDKTGTLTEGAMVAEVIWTPDREVTLTGSGFDPRGSISDTSEAANATSSTSLVQLLTAGVLCNDANLEPPPRPGEPWQAVGDPTEAALITAAMKLPLAPEQIRQDHPRVMELPFDSDRKRMSTVHRHPNGQLLVVCKGAPEVLLDVALLTDNPELVAAAAARANLYAQAGYRVLAIATTIRSERPTSPDSIEHDLRLAGLVALTDPPRPAAAATIQSCLSAGIAPVIVTGDHAATAHNIADRVGIPATSVVARTDPGQKLALVAQWQDAGEVVAMTGDGVNDAPALRRADVGVAMGLRGTEIARAAADIVLTDDDLGTVVAAVEEGRRVYANVRRFLLYALSGGAAEILVMLLGPAAGISLPLLPAQILWINLLTHGLPGVAMGAEPIEPGAMRRPPRPATESIIGRGLWARVLTIGMVVASLALGAGMWAASTDQPRQTSVFLTLGMAQFGVALGMRARPASCQNAFLLMAVATSVLLELAAIYLAPLRDLLGTRPLHLGLATTLSTAAVVGYAVTRISRHRQER